MSDPTFTGYALTKGLDANGNDLFINVGTSSDNSNCIQTSSNGSIWNNLQVNLLTKANGATFCRDPTGINKFAVVGDNGLIISQDGINWEHSYDSGTNNGTYGIGLTGVAFGITNESGMCIAVGGYPDTNLPNGPMVLIISDTVTWQTQQIITTSERPGFNIMSQFNGIAYGQMSATLGRWVIVGTSRTETDGCIITTTNGTQWLTPSTDVFTGGVSRAVAFNSDLENSLWVAVGEAPANDGTEGSTYKISTSSNGITWTRQVCELDMVNNVAHGKDVNGAGLWIITGLIGEESAYATSSDGITWTTHIFQSSFIPNALMYSQGSGNSSNMWIVTGTSPTNTIIYNLDPIDGAWIFTNTEEPQVPGPVVDLLVTPGILAANLSWTAPLSDGGSAITSYIITSSSTHINTVPANETGVYNVDVPEIAGVYTFSVVAVNSVGSSAVSSMTVEVLPLVSTVPGPVVNLLVTPDVFSVNISWNAPLSDGGLAITSYTISSSIDDISVPANETGAYSLKISGLTGEYTFSVIAINSAGSSQSSVSPPIQVLQSRIPDAPTNVSASPLTASALVSWTPGFNGGSAITGYRIFSFPDNKRINTAPASATSLNVTGLKNGIPHTFTVVAMNALGSSSTVGSTPSTLPGVPKVTVVGGNAQATLSWVSKPAVGVPTTEFILSCNQELTLPTNPVSPLTINGLTNGVSYVFSVRAKNIIGTSAAGLSKAIVPTTIPDVPTQFAVLAGIKSFQVTWAPPFNGGLPITDYPITYVGGGKTTIAKGKAVAPHTLMVTKLVTGTVYTVTMQAKNKLGVSVATESITVTVE